MKNFLLFVVMVLASTTAMSAEPKFKIGDKVMQEPTCEARLLRVHVINGVEWDSYYKTWRYGMRAGGTATEKNIHAATKSEIRDARRIKITMEELSRD